MEASFINTGLCKASKMSVNRIITTIMLGAYSISTPAIAQEAQTRAEESATQLETITLWGTWQTGTAATEGTGEYTTTEMNTATGIAMAPRETPQSTSVITREQIDDLAVTTAADALQRATGIAVIRDSGRYRFQSRGFYIDQIQEDGVNYVAPGAATNPYQTSSSMTDLEIYDHIEVVRGATGLVQSNGEPGGTVNLVRKRPTEEFQASASQTVGSFDHYRSTGDVSGKLNAAGSVRGRIVGVHDQANSFKDNVDSRNDTLYGVLDFDLTDDTTLTVGGVFQESKGVPDFFGLPRGTGGSDLGLPRSTYLGADWNKETFHKKEAFAELNHDFNDEWSASARLSYQQTDSNQTFAALGSGSTSYAGVGSNGLLSTNNMQRYDNTGDQTGAHVTLAGRYDLLGRTHDVFAGASHSFETLDSRWRRVTNSTSYNIWTFDGSSIAEPNWNNSSILQNDVSYHHETELKSVNFGTRLSVIDPMKVLLGGRYTDYTYNGYYQYKTWAGSPDNEYGKYETMEKQKFIPYAGVTYDLTPEVTLYASYTSIFKPQSAADETGKILDPVTGTNYEAGVKAELLDGRVLGTFALFNIEQENRAIYNAATSAYMPEGKVRSRGFDVEVAGEVQEGWNMMAGYTYNTSEYLETESTRYISGGNYSPHTPEHMFRFYTTYNLPFHDRRWTAGGGVRMQSESLSVYNATFARYAVFDASLDYRLNDNVNLNLVAKNLFDKTYYESNRTATNGMNNFYGEPFNIGLTLKMKM